MDGLFLKEAFPFFRPQSSGYGFEVSGFAGAICIDQCHDIACLKPKDSPPDLLDIPENTSMFFSFLYIGTLFACIYPIWGPPFELVEMETITYEFAFSLSDKSSRVFEIMDDDFSKYGSDT